MDSRLSTVSIFSVTFSFLINAITIIELPPPTMLPNNNPFSRRQPSKYLQKTAVTITFNVHPVIANTKARGLFLTASRISMFKPPSKRIMIKAKAAKYGVIASSSS